MASPSTLANSGSHLRPKTTRATAKIKSRRIGCKRPPNMLILLLFFLTQATNYLKAEPDATTTTKIPSKIQPGVKSLAQPIWLSYHLAGNTNSFDADVRVASPL